MFYIKKDIRVAVKKNGVPPETKIGKTEKPEEDYYKIGRLLGRGSFGKVNLALHKLSRKCVAVKSINKKLKTDNQYKKIRNEVNIMKQLRHKNVV
jgi:serine/threonine protein kinase